MSCWHILEIKPLSITLFANIFSHSVVYLFFNGFLGCAKAYKFDQAPLTYFCFNFYCFRETDIKNIATINIQKTKIMASGPITSWQIDGKQWKQWLTIFLGSKITADGDYSYEIEKTLTPWKESYD